MRPSPLAGIALVAILVSAAVGYRYGAGAWPSVVRYSASGTGTAIIERGPQEIAQAADRAVLYWQDPNGRSDFSAEPKATVGGRPYVPVYDEQEPAFAGTQLAKASTSGKLLYYRNPMGLADVSKVPKKDSMGMDYIPVYEGEGDADGSTVKISLDRVQRSGVRTELASLRKLARPVHAAGTAKLNERSLRVVTLRADGFIEKLYVNETGEHVQAGEPLFRIYSPQMVSAEIDYRTAMTSPGRGPRDEGAALQRLRNLDFPDSALKELKANPNPPLAIDWPAPVSGVVLQKRVVEGMMVKAGDELYRLADLDTIWVIADVSEQDIGLLKVGMPARLSFRAYPGETFDGSVTFILHELEMVTRTAKVRIEINNIDHRIKHEMFADVDIDTGAGDGERLVVPTSAVIDSGTRQIVLVDKGQGRFEPRAVKVGLRGDGLFEIKAGLKVGEPVVVTANFLIDAESNLKAALQAFTAEAASGTIMETKP